MSKECCGLTFESIVGFVQADVLVFVHELDDDDDDDDGVMYTCIAQSLHAIVARSVRSVG